MDKEILYFLSHYTTYEYKGPHEVLAGGVTPWIGHVIFADMLIRAYRPQCLVELGSHTGVSFFAFCEAVKQSWLKTTCYAVDTWKGDEQAGFYGEDVYIKFSEYNKKYYSNFATMLRMKFDDAIQYFKDESIDILHIDGLHTYDAVKHDFYTWLPKVKPGGIILFHDVAEQGNNFGVYKLWHEIAEKSQEICVFPHSHGLAVWRKPGGPVLDNPLLQDLLSKDKEISVPIVELIKSTSEYFTNNHKLKDIEKKYNILFEKYNYLSQENINLKNMHAKLKNEFESILNSNSWKITFPLRGISRWLRKKLSKNG